MAMPPGETQRGRRVKFGLNVAVAVAATIAIAVLVNWIASRQFVRYDFTATRKYSLSPQTRNLLSSLKSDHQFVTLFSRGGPYIEQARDLVEEYARRGHRVTAEHIDPGREIGRLEAFYASLRKRYEDEVSPLHQVVLDSRSALHTVQQSASRLLEPMGRLLEDATLTDEELKRFIQSVAQAFARFGGDIDAIDKQVLDSLDQPLPRYGQAKQNVVRLLGALDEKVFTLAIEQFGRAVVGDQLSPSVKNSVLGIMESLKRTRTGMQEAVAALIDAPAVEAYDQLVGQIEQPDVVALIGPDQIRVIGIGEMFREPDPQQVEPGRQPQLRFQGEEKITGALMSMSLEHQPMVVFVTPGQTQAIGHRGEFQQVAARLRSASFQVEQWSPMPQPGPMGAATPAAAPPLPQPGQKAVWVVLPIEAPNPMNPTGAGAAGRVVGLIQERLDAGDAAMVMPMLSPSARFGGPDPLAQMLEPWGITPQVDRVVLRELEMPNNKTQATSQLEVFDWPGGLSVTQALAGMPGVFLQACPLVLGSGDGQGVETWPLVQVSGQDMWAQRDPQSQPSPKLDPATAGGPFVIAAAAQRQGGRIVVVADPAWASDQITNYGQQGLPAEIFGAAFPANAELFMNSVYWLAGLDQLIAASPRSQDIRRVGPISPVGLTALRWALMAGMPLVVVAVGVGVSVVRQRG